VYVTKSFSYNNNVLQIDICGQSLKLFEIAPNFRGAGLLKVSLSTQIVIAALRHIRKNVSRRYNVLPLASKLLRLICWI